MIQGEIYRCSKVGDETEIPAEHSWATRQCECLCAGMETNSLYMFKSGKFWVPGMEETANYRVGRKGRQAGRQLLGCVLTGDRTQAMWIV